MSIVDQTFRLTSLRLLNYRRFEQFFIEFDEQLTVLAANNGCGKTAILDAAAVALSSLVAELDKSKARGFWPTDVRLKKVAMGQTIRALPTQLDAVGKVGDRELTWTLKLERDRTSFAGTKPISKYATGLRDQLLAPRRPALPVIAYYGTGRLWSENRGTQKRKATSKNLADATGAYLDCLGSASNYKQFVEWFERIVREAQDEKETGQKSPHRPAELLIAVRKAADHVLAPVGWHTLSWGHLEHEVMATHDERGRLPVSLLSDGVRNLLGIVADLAHRCVRLNPQFGSEACVYTSGVVLIDEIDMHLHPQWQQTVVQSLIDAFPKVQFILSTHSPQVLSTVDAKCIRIISDDGSVSRPHAQTKGTLSSDVLLDVMAVNPEPDLPETKLLATYQTMIQVGDGTSAKANEIRTQLVQHYGAEHPVVLDCDRMIRMFTRRAAIAG